MIGYTQPDALLLRVMQHELRDLGEQVINSARSEKASTDATVNKYMTNDILLIFVPLSKN